MATALGHDTLHCNAGCGYEHVVAGGVDGHLGHLGGGDGVVLEQNTQDHGLAGIESTIAVAEGVRARLVEDLMTGDA